MIESEIEISEDLVRNLLQDQHPDLEPARIGEAVADCGSGAGLVC
ncbi:hypothetical protein AADR41_35840 [Streptomyces sp. CLV115]